MNELSTPMTVGLNIGGTKIASGPVLLRRYRAGGAAAVERAEDVFAAARSGDPIAREVIETAGECVGATIGLLVNVLDPHAVVTGGGIGSAESLYWQSLEGAARRSIWWDTQSDLPIVRATFGEGAGVVGTAVAALGRH